MTPGGRPEIGNPIHVRVGGLLEDIDAFRVDHGYRKRQRPDAVRELIRRGIEASGGERILIDPVTQARYSEEAPDDAHTISRYRDALAKGAVLRKSDSPADSINRAQLIQYTDPLDGSARCAVTFEDSQALRFVDYTDRVVAEREYEREVRWLAESDWLFQVTDVAGVPTRATNPEPDDF